VGENYLGNEWLSMRHISLEVINDHRNQDGVSAGSALKDQHCFGNTKDMSLSDLLHFLLLHNNHQPGDLSFLFLLLHSVTANGFKISVCLRSPPSLNNLPVTSTTN
jgi:hypothetical protein